MFHLHCFHDQKRFAFLHLVALPGQQLDHNAVHGCGEHRRQIRLVLAVIGFRHCELHRASLAEQSELAIVRHDHHALAKTVDIGG